MIFYIAERLLFLATTPIDMCILRTQLTDENLTGRIAKFQCQLKSEYVHRISLKFLCDLDLVNQCFTLNKKYILTLKTEMQKLFEANVNQNVDALPTTIDADIVFTGASYIMYKQFELDDNFKNLPRGNNPILEQELK